MQSSGAQDLHRRYLNGLELIFSFRHQFAALCDADNLKVLREVGPEWFTNTNVREILGSERQSSWVRLSRLCRAGLVEKRGHSYRIPRYTLDFVEAVARTLAGLTSLEELSADSELSGLFRVASEGIDLLYGKGRISQPEYAKAKDTLERFGAKVGLQSH